MRDGVVGTRTGESAWLPSTPFLPDWLFDHADRTPAAPAIASPTVRLTYAELAGHVLAMAGHMARLGLVPGDRVLLALPNGPAAVVVGLALNAIGAVSLEVSREWGGDVLEGIVERAGCRRAVIWARDASRWTERAAGVLEHAMVLQDEALPTRHRGRLGAVPVTELLPDGSLDPSLQGAPLRRQADLDPDQPALVLYTSGSTGAPHGVIQTFRNIDANSRSIVTYLGLGRDDRAMLTLPLSYCYGRSVLQTHLLVGGSVFLDHRTAFPRTILETMAAEGCTGFAGVPLTFEVIRRQVDVSTIAFPSLRYLTQAGGAMAAETIDWVRAAFAPATLYVMYGQTEATARLSYLPPDRAVTKRGSIGVPIPGVDLRVVDEDGQEVPIGVIGELVARGANVSPGYFDDPDETSRILRDGWLWTGDLAERDIDGFLYHRGRAREIFKVGGHRVSPMSIEAVLAGHSQVAEVVVVGAPDSLLGEVPIAVIVPQAGTAPEERELLQFCRDRLPGPWVPTRIRFVERLPRNEAGKPLRREVARLYGAAL